MNAELVELVQDIEERGLSVSVTGGDLRLQGMRDRMDPELVGRIKRLKAELIQHLSAATPHESGSFPLTPLQHAYLLGRGGVFEISTASHVYHEIEGHWDVGRLEAALNAVIRRHDALRARFTEDGRQVVEASVAPVLIERLDLRGQSPEQQLRTRAALREERSHRVLPADRAPLLAVEVTELSDRAMVLHVSHDGLVMDGISSFLFFREWWRAYQGELAAEGAELPLEDYVSALAAAAVKAPAARSRAYWSGRLDQLAAHPDLPVAASPAAITRPRFVQRQVRLDAAQWAAFKRRAAGAGLTPSGALLAAYGEVLSRWGAGERFTVTTTVANRPPVHHRIAEAVGQFSDTLLVEIEVDRSKPFAARAQALQRRLRTDLDHRHQSGIEVLRELGRRRGSAEARMPFTFNSAIGYTEEVDGSAFELFGPEVFSVSQTPQIWLNAFAMEQHQGLVIQLDGLDELFPAGLLEALTQGYQSLLEQLLEDRSWARTGFDLLPGDQLRRRRAANDTAVELPEVLLQDAFTERATSCPDNPALITSQLRMSYGELHRRAALTAAWLRSHGVGRNELVGLVMRRGPEQIIGILATVLAGAAYLPVDAALPEERRRYMLADGEVRCVLTNVDDADRDGRAVLRLDATDPAPTGAPVPLEPLAGADPDDLAYVLYTSGTTGAPKGVMVTHRNVANVVADCYTRFGIHQDDRFFAISAFNFDLSVWDVFGALTAGAALVMPDADRAVDPAHWLRMCESGGVTVWNSVPAIVGLMHDQALAEGTAPPALRLVMMSGDRLPPALPAALRRLVPGLEVVSLGGPTETTVWNILHPVEEWEDGSESIPYGRPNTNNRAYVLDADGQDAPDWVTGEICGAGTGVAKGYWRNEERTAEKFGYDERLGERLYRTGDLGRYLPSGEIQILGRSDFQIKVNGYRIEAGEVETRLAALPAVRQAVVVRQEGSRGDRLVAHLVPAAADRPDVLTIRHELREALPEYMVPAAVVWHEELPLTRNGKVDRGELIRRAPVAEPAEQAAAPMADDGEAGPTETELTRIWAQILHRPAVGPHDNLYALGGDSISAARILTAVRKRFGVGIQLGQLAALETVRLMAAHVDAAMAAKEAQR
ncbi:non-ribosomal peptide synthetase [Kitasatospora cathayae]|uniref:Phenyloxazoline synthase MbtB n=1 Tax=Kitasatospora cathayae TaxID=3004092 RepID=A0ABY7Q0H1_9ACTN|nr:amino acid adenylation domain-containing protein [Kitasatospora sp. HUAS 3-15]WBP86190.1 amino acid adenylation domain-containing protein [Kitasatospora sp. HUAS 3-15]